MKILEIVKKTAVVLSLVLLNVYFFTDLKTMSAALLCMCIWQIIKIYEYYNTKDKTMLAVSAFAAIAAFTSALIIKFVGD